MAGFVGHHPLTLPDLLQKAAPQDVDVLHLLELETKALIVMAAHNRLEAAKHDRCPDGRSGSCADRRARCRNIEHIHVNGDVLFGAQTCLAA